MSITEKLRSAIKKEDSASEEACSQWIESALELGMANGLEEAQVTCATWFVQKPDWFRRQLELLASAVSKGTFDRELKNVERELKKNIAQGKKDWSDLKKKIEDHRKESLRLEP